MFTKTFHYIERALRFRFRHQDEKFFSAPPRHRIDTADVHPGLMAHQ